MTPVEPIIKPTLSEALADLFTELRKPVERAFDRAGAWIITWRGKHPSKRTLRRQLVDAQGSALVYKIAFRVTQETAQENLAALQAVGEWYADLVKSQDLVQMAATQILNGNHPQRGIAAGALIEAGAKCR